MSDISEEEQKKIVSDAIKAYAKGGPDIRMKLMQSARKAGQRWLSDESFAKRFEHGKHLAFYVCNGETYMQFWLFGDHKNPETVDNPDEKKPVIMPVLLADWDPKDDDEKQMYMKGIGIKFAEEFPNHMLTTIVHISEAWALQLPADAPDEDLNLRPSTAPDRIEMLMVTAMSMDQRQSYVARKMLRDDEGKFTGLSEKPLYESIYDPKKPAPIDKSKNYLSAGIFMGYGLAQKGKE